MPYSLDVAAASPHPRAYRRRSAALSLALGAATLATLAGCPDNNGMRDAATDGGGDGGNEPACPVFEDDPSAPTWCSVGNDVPGAVVPPGFCLRQFATVGSPRRLAFACNGDLLVSAPSNGAPGGSGGGPGAIVLFSDDNRDGTGEMSMFATRLADVHGLAGGGGYVWFTTLASVFRTPYMLGQRAETAGAREDLQVPSRWNVPPTTRWTHGLARSAGGRLIGSTGGYGTCGDRLVGEIASVDHGTLDTLATGFRNPMYLRCHFRDEVCLGAELGEDQTTGAREKLVAVSPGAAGNYGFPCCHTTGVSYLSTDPSRCGSVTREDYEYRLGDTPFGFDWERGSWPAPFASALFVALHGSFYTSPAWEGAGIVYLPTDPTTHLPTDRPANPPQAVLPAQTHYFVQGFGPGGSPLERPADIAFSPDGRMFFADDLGGAIYWVAPTTLHQMRAR